MLGAAAAAGVPGPVAFCVGRLVALDSGIRFDRICVCFDRELSSSEFATYDFKDKMTKIRFIKIEFENKI